MGPAVPAVLLGLRPSSYLMQQFVDYCARYEEIKACLSILLLNASHFVDGMTQVLLPHYATEALA
jgi:hypothetical protein